MDEAGFSISAAVAEAAKGGPGPKGGRLRFSDASARPRTRALDLTSGAGAVGTLRATAADFVEASRARSIAGLLGARFASYGGGRVQVDVPRITAGSTTSWTAEGSPPGAKTNPAIAQKVVLTPRQLTASGLVTRAMVARAGPDLDEWLLADLAGAVGAAVDAAAFNGGGGAAPTGLLSSADVPTLAIGTNGGEPTRTLLLTAMKMVGNANGGASATASLGWASSVDGEAKLRATDGSTGNAGRWLWDDDRILDKPAHSSTSLPNTLTKGSGTGLSPLIYGDFDQLLVNMPDDGMDVMVNPVTVAPDLLVTVFLDVAVAVRRGSAFVKVLDMVTTLS